MKTLLISMCFVLFSSSCATTHLAWKVKDGDNKQASADLAKCQKESFYIPSGRFGHGKYDFIIACMNADGHQLVEVSDEQGGS